jgi:parvulin-like peptidyl-prolyl isomerase
MNMKRLFTLIGLIVLPGALLLAQTNLQPAAIVNLTRSEPISVGQLKAEVEKMERQAGRALSVPERRQVLDVMINERLALQAAERDRVTLTDNEVNQQIQQLRTNLTQTLGRQPTDAEFATAVRNETGLDLPAFREQIRRQGIIQKYLMAQKQDLIQSAQSYEPSAAEISRAYQNNQTSFVRPATIRYSMIQVSFGQTPAERTAARTRADQLVREIGSSPARFDEAVMRGQTPNVGYQAGDAGYLPRNAQAQQLVGQAFLDVAFSLAQGAVSPLIESPLGYHIIKVTETYEMKALGLDDVIQPGTRVNVREYIKNQLALERQQAIVEQASQELVNDLRARGSIQVIEANLNW